METPKISPAATPESQAHFLDYWRIIRIRKTVILAVFLLIVLTTVGVTFILKRTYESTVSIKIERDTKDIDPLLRQNNQLNYDPYFIATEFETIQSMAILDPVIDSLKLRDKWAERYNEPKLTQLDTYEILKKNLDVRQTRNTSMIEIRAYSEDPAEAQTIANAVADSYKKWRLSTKKGQSVNAIAALKGKLVEQNAAVTNLQNEVDKLRIELGIPESANSDAGYQATLEREKVSAVQSRLIEAESEYVFFKTKLDHLTNLPPDKLRNTIPTAIPTERQLELLNSDLAATEQKLAQKRTLMKDDHPEVQELLKLKAQVELQIKERMDGALEGLQNQVVSTKARIDLLATQVKEGRKEAADAAAKGRGYYAKKRDLDSQNRIRDAILMRTIQEEVDSAIPSSSVVEIINPAQLKLRAVRPNFALNIALGIVVGLVMGVGLAFFIEYLDTSVKTIDDVERALQAPVIGVIPQNVGLLINEGPESPHAEAYRVLRTNVLFSRKNPEQNTMTVVSGGAGEGKSTTIFNLATVFAQNGARVLIVDSDLRRPSLHKILDVSNAIGLTNFLLKQNTLEEVVQTTKIPSLDFLPSGKLPSSSMGLLSSQRMAEFVKDVKQRYDFVFFDSPPIMGVSDASILASAVDLAVLVVQYRKYPQAINLRAKQMVEKVGGNLLGIVLNNINISQDSYYYYYSGYYYDYYSKGADESGDAKGSKREKSRSKDKGDTKMADAAGAKTGELTRKY